MEPNEKKDRQEDKEVFRQLTQNDYKGLNPSKESRDKKAEKLKEDLDIMIQTAITGTAQLYVADIVEGKYHNALPSLMVKAFETNAQYVNCFENFVGKYMPTFAEKIEDVVPLFKQFMN